MGSCGHQEGGRSIAAQSSLGPPLFTPTYASRSTPTARSDLGDFTAPFTARRHFPSPRDGIREFRNSAVSRPERAVKLSAKVESVFADPCVEIIRQFARIADAANKPSPSPWIEPLKTIGTFCAGLVTAYLTQQLQARTSVSVAAKNGAIWAGLWRCCRWQQPLPAFARAAGRTIRFWTFPCRVPRVTSSRRRANLLMFRLPSTSGRVVLVVRHFAPSRTATNTSENREKAQMWRIVYMELAKNFLTQDAIVRPISNMTEP